MRKVLVVLGFPLRLTAIIIPALLLFVMGLIWPATWDDCGDPIKWADFLLGRG
jgi:hypothetical protein